ncbi:MAG: choice-of-anchor tandem repeat GloVer-containing protein, partial [Terriglobales bacterium]
LSSLLLIVDAVSASETVLYNFCSVGRFCTDGSFPTSRLTPDGGGNYYGTTYEGGTQNEGAVFELSPNGVGGWDETVLYSFCSLENCADGRYPFYSYLLFDNAGNLYGTAFFGGANDLGVVFELSPAGGGWKETVLYSFALDEGGNHPANGLIMDAEGNLYGGNQSGVFELSPSGGGWTEQLIYLTSYGYAAPIMDATGNIFGVTYVQTAFELSPNGSGGWNSSVIYTFADALKNGSYPQGTLALDSAGNLYGTTTAGGTFNYGTVYKLTPVKTGKKKGTWTEKLLHSFNGKNGNEPWAGIVFDSVGNIYGTTDYGGKYGDGTVFQLVQVAKGNYTEKVLTNFNGVDGNSTVGNLFPDSSGNLYGTAELGGLYGDGLVFEVTP